MAVTPIMKFDVAAATLNGTRMPIAIAGTLRNPPPTPSMPDATPAANEMPSPTGVRSAW